MSDRAWVHIHEATRGPVREDWESLAFKQSSEGETQQLREARLAGRT
jgi:hypothetical protein